jgi:hypothetical protein
MAPATPTGWRWTSSPRPSTTSWRSPSCCAPTRPSSMRAREHRPPAARPCRAAVTLAGDSPRRATFFLVVRQERRQRNVPRCRAPFGGSLLPAMPGGVFANSPCGLKHAKPFFRPSSPPVGTPEGRGNAGDQRPVPDSSSAGARCIRKARSDPPSSAPAGGEVRRGCLSPKGEFRAGRLLGAAQGSRPQADRGWPGRLLCLLSWRSKKEGRPPGDHLVGGLPRSTSIRWPAP